MALGLTCKTCKSCALNLYLAEAERTVDTSFQGRFHNLLFEPLLCSVSRLYPEVQEWGGAWVELTLGPFLGNGSFSLWPLLLRSFFSASRAALNSGESVTESGLAHMHVTKTLWCSTVCSCLSVLILGNIFWCTTMIFIPGQSQTSWVTWAVICYYLE